MSDHEPAGGEVEDGDELADEGAVIEEDAGGGPRLLFLAGLAGAAVAALVVGLAIVLGVFEGGEVAPSGPAVTAVVLARGRTESYDPVGPGTAFPADGGEVVALLTLENITEAVTLKGVWYYLGRTGQASPFKKAEASVEVRPTGQQVRKASLSLKQSIFDQGVYELEVLLDGERKETVQFRITEPLTPRAAAVAAATPTPAPRPTATSAPAGPPPPPPPTRPPPPTFPPGVELVYHVRPGDTLPSIAASFRVSLQSLLEFNGLAPGAVVQPGTILRLPPGADAVPDPNN
jgi:hypothetical protein